MGHCLTGARRRGRSPRQTLITNITGKHSEILHRGHPAKEKIGGGAVEFKKLNSTWVSILYSILFLFCTKPRRNQPTENVHAIRNVCGPEPHTPLAPLGPRRHSTQYDVKKGNLGRYVFIDSFLHIYLLICLFIPQFLRMSQIDTYWNIDSKHYNSPTAVPGLLLLILYYSSYRSADNCRSHHHRFVALWMALRALKWELKVPR